VVSGDEEGLAGEGERVCEIECAGEKGFGVLIYG